MLVSIVLGVVTLVVLVLAFLASKHWHWAHVLVVVTFYFVSVTYAFLAARSLDTRNQGQRRLAEARKNLERITEENDALVRGTRNGGLVNRLRNGGLLVDPSADSLEGVVQKRHELRLVTRERGRAWRDAQPISGVDPQTGAVTIGVPVPVAPSAEDETGAFGDGSAEEAPAADEPLGMETDAIVYVFEQGALEGAAEDSTPNRYLGEFRVTDVAGREAKLLPLDQLMLDPEAGQRLLDSVGPWVVYESMPTDRRDLFADLDEEALRQALPASSVEEYLRDGGEPTPDDPRERLQPVDADGVAIAPDDAEAEPDRVVAYRYRRLLRDYAFLLNDLEKERAELVARQQAVEADLKKLATAQAGADQIEAFRRDQIARLQTDLDAVTRDRKLAESHRDRLQQQIAGAKRLLAATLDRNAELAAARAAQRGSLAPMATGALDIDAL